SMPMDGPSGGDAEADIGEEDTEEAGAARTDHGNGDGRRRRRRGRRGGRRNRREEDTGISPPENGVPPIDEEGARAVADFCGAPSHRATPRPPPHPALAAPTHAPPPPPAAPGEAPNRDPPPTRGGEPVAPPKPELPRRRSTVREPAPFPVGNAAAAPQSAP